MTKISFRSIFASEMEAYLQNKVSSGYNEKSYVYHLKNFDRFCMNHNLMSPSFTRELADEWIKRRDSSETSTTHYSRVNVIKHFLIYLSNKGFDVFVTRDIAFKQTSFQPHIYSEEEIRKYFESVDTFHSSRNKKDQIQYPVLFRLLYCCGTRINETLGIRKQDVDLDAGIIKLFETKNNCERYIVLGDDLISLMKQFASRCFYLLNEEDYIFTSANGGRLSGKTIYMRHRLFLKKAGIPYIGGSLGPRIQDWRYPNQNIIQTFLENVVIEELFEELVWILFNILTSSSHKNSSIRPPLFLFHELMDSDYFQVDIKLRMIIC